MKKLSVALLLVVGTILAGCKSNESKPEEAAPPPQAAAAPAPAPVAAKPECPPEPATKKKTSKESTKAKNAKKAAPAPADCEPAKPKTTASPKAAEPPKPEPAATPATGSPAGKACNPCVVKSKDGTFDGEIYGSIPPGSKWAKLQIGMHQSEVERILGVTSNVRAYVTAKAWIPFYFGGDSHRYEAVYAGQGSVAYTGGSFGGGQGILMMINFDPKIQ